MNCEIKFKKIRIVRAIIVVLIFLCMSIWLIVNPKIFIRNFLMTERGVMFMGLFSGIFFLPLLLSFIIILPRKVALIITDDYLLDRSKYESLGKIYWSEITKIKRENKRYLRITFEKPVFEERDVFFVKKFLLYMQNWKYENSIIITSGLLECDIDYLEAKILKAYRSYKRKILSKRNQCVNVMDCRVDTPHKKKWDTFSN